MRPRTRLWLWLLVVLLSFLLFVSTVDAQGVGDEATRRSLLESGLQSHNRRDFAASAEAHSGEPWRSVKRRPRAPTTPKPSPRCPEANTWPKRWTRPSCVSWRRP